VEALLSGLDPTQTRLASRAFGNDERRTWSYLPGTREGLALHVLPRDLQQRVVRLLTAALRPHALAQVTAVMALEDVLDLAEGGSGRRHRGDYWVTVFGRPEDDRWGWRFEGHHVSVNVTLVDGSLRAVPQFLGANPAVVRHRGDVVSAPLGREEEVARAVLDALDLDARAMAVVSAEAPRDIRTTRRPRVDDPAPEGVGGAALDPPAMRCLQALVEVYLERLAEPLVAAQRTALDDGGWEQVHFQWRGSTGRGAPHYYAVSGPRLLVEYDNTQNDANHIHSVLRDPQGDFGADLLGEHYERHH